jgi:hypothetical protein
MFVFIFPTLLEKGRGEEGMKIGGEFCRR